MYVRLVLRIVNDHRLCTAPKPIPNFEAKSLLARLVLPWGTRWESRVLLIQFFFGVGGGLDSCLLVDVGGPSAVFSAVFVLFSYDY